MLILIFLDQYDMAQVCTSYGIIAIYKFAMIVQV